jgi:hypothetical protein
MGMTTFCITCPAELPEEHEAAVNHFKERSIEANFINGIHAETFGILAWRPYRKDNPKSGFVIKMAAVGLALTHHMIWQICQYHHDDTWLITEADADFPENWKEKLDQALSDVPADYDILLIGNSNSSDKPQTHIKGEVWEVKYPFCTHAYIIRESSLETLLSIRDAATNNDIAMIDRAYPKLKTFTVLPSLVKQRGRELMP